MTAAEARSAQPAFVDDLELLVEPGGCGPVALRLPQGLAPPAAGATGDLGLARRRVEDLRRRYRARREAPGAAT